jgi:hypothetical protein
MGTPMRNVVQPSAGFFPDSHFAYLVRSPRARDWKVRLRFPADRRQVTGKPESAGILPK